MRFRRKTSRRRPRSFRRIKRSFRRRGMKKIRRIVNRQIDKKSETKWIAQIANRTAITLVPMRDAAGVF